MAPPPPPPSRRALLGGAGSALVLGALSGCGTDWRRVRVQPVGGDPAPSAPPPDADELARRRAAAACARVRATATAPGAPAGAAAVLAALAAATAEQLAALGGGPAPSATGSSPTTPSAAGSPTTPSGPVAPLDGLPAALTAAAASAREDLPGVSGGMARLLASLAAADDLAAAAVAAALGRPAPAAPASTPASTPAATASPSASAAPSTGGAAATALAAALDTEEAAVYGYGVVAVRLAGPQRQRALDDLGAHARTVEDLRARSRAAGATPPPAAPGWSLPGPVHDAPAALALAVHLEDASTAAAADLVAADAPAQRPPDAALLADRAARAAAWRAEAGGPPVLVALPGLSGR